MFESLIIRPTFENKPYVSCGVVDRLSGDGY